MFQLGQHYLGLANEKDAELNNRLAVNWLIKAAKQGRKGAARALQRCWIQKKGTLNTSITCDSVFMLIFPNYVSSPTRDHSRE